MKDETLTASPFKGVTGGFDESCWTSFEKVRGEMRIDILFYAHEPGLKETGAVRKILGLSRGLRQAGATVRVVVPRFLNLEVPHLDLVTYPTVPVQLLRPISAYLAMVWVAWRQARRKAPNLVYARTSRNVLPALLARWIGARFVFEINGDAFGEQGWRSGIARSLTILAADWINCRLAHRIVALTPGLKATVERRYRVPPEKVCLIPSGTDTALIRPLDVAECRGTLGLPPVGAVIVFLGVLYHHQGLQTLVAAAPEILRQHPGARFLIVGDGPARPELEAQAQALGLSASVAFVGQVPYEHVPLYLGAADCCVAPYTAQRGETSPLKLFDYMAAGRSVVTSAIPSIAELIKESGAIVPVPPDDPRGLAKEVAALLSDPGRRQILGEAGRRYVEPRHGWDYIANAFVEDICLRDD